MKRCGACASLLLLALTSSSQNRPVKRVFKPACDVWQLNKEYAALLHAKRQQLTPRAPAVVVEGTMLPDVIRHNQAMEQRDSLYHADRPGQVELVGMNSELWACRRDPRLLAQAIWSQFQASTKGHCEAQANPEHCRVAVSCSQRYFIVRLYRSSVIGKD